MIFSSNGVLVGDTYFTLFTRGISRFIHVQSEAHPAALIDFSMRLKIVGAGTLGQTARYRGSLRIPVADDAMPEAAYVVARFRQLVG